MAGVFYGVEAVIFDAVGTLIRPDPPAIEAYRRIGREFGADLPLEEIERRFRAAFREAFADSVYAPTDDATERAKWRQVVASVFRGTGAPLDELFPALWDHFASSRNWSLYPDAAAPWRELAARGYRLGVASNYDDRLPAVLSGLPPLDRCADVYWSSQIGYSKPNRLFFSAVANRLSVAPENILLVGDDPENDFQGATSAGWRAVLVNRTGGAASPTTIASLAEIPQFLS